MGNDKNKTGKPVDISGIDPKVLRSWIQHDKTRWTAVKCQGLIALAEGASVKEVCKVLKVTRETLRLWRDCLKKEGVDGFTSNKKKGKKTKLTIEVKNDLQNAVRNKPFELGHDEKSWTGKLVVIYLKEKWNIEIAVRTAQNWLQKPVSEKLKGKD